MAITSVDILNLSHSLKDICEVNCNTPECLSQTLKILLQYNLIQANLQFGRQLERNNCPAAPAAVPDSARCVSSVSGSPSSAPKPPARLDVGDPFLADHER